MDIRDILRQARTRLLEGDYDSALKLYLEAVEQNPDSLAALNALGFILYFKNDTERGFGFCRRAVELYPDDAYARKGLGLYLERMGHYEEAVISVRKAIELDPDFIDAYHDLAFIFYKAGDFDSAREWLARGTAKCHDARYRRVFDRFFSKLDDISPR